MDIDIVVDKARFRDWLDVSLVQTDRNGGVIAAAREVMFDPVEDGKYIQPTFHLTRQYAQHRVKAAGRQASRALNDKLYGAVLYELPVKIIAGSSCK